MIFSRRPGPITQEYEVPLPYPRDPFELRGAAEFAELNARIWNTVGREFRENREEG